MNILRQITEKKFFINWCKALMLSPGVLFPAAYLLVYTSTNIYLNAAFKHNLAHSVNQATGNTWNTSISSVTAGLILDSIKLNHVTLSPADTTAKNSKRITLTTLEIPCNNLQLLLFSPSKRFSSTETISEKILSEWHLVQ
ncbi:MAG: hypothetical protein WCG61_01690 [Chlorobium sp.]